MNSRPQVPALSFTPETLMGDLFRLTRKVAPALPFLDQFQIIRLRQELAIVELLVEKHIDIAGHMREAFASSRRGRAAAPLRVLELPRGNESDTPRAA